jgi:hypothetical protein
VPFLDAALAFALTMLAVSTAAGQILNLVRKFFGFRAEQMRDMLERFIESDLQPVLEREMHRLVDRGANEARSAVLAAAGRFTSSDVAKLCPGSPLFDPSKWRFSLKERLNSVSTEELIEALKQSEVGTELLAQFHDNAETVFQEIGARWDRVGTGVSAQYRITSGRLATLVALLLAVMMNIDSWFIVDRYLNDRQLTAAVIAQMDDIQASADSAFLTIARTDRLLAALAAASASEATVAGDSTLAIASAQTIDSIAAIDWDQLAAGLAATSEGVKALEESGLPLGSGYFPTSCYSVARQAGLGQWASLTSVGRPTCIDPYGRSLWKWLLGIALTGLLAGLGAPFWYDVVSGISRVTRVARGSQNPRQPQQPSSSTG